MLSAVLAALGGALFESPRSAAIAALTTEVERPRFFSLAGVAGGLGTTVGTQIGALLLKADFALVSLGGAACFLLIFVLTLIFLPSVRVAPEGGPVWHGLGLAVRDRPFMTFNGLMMGHWFMWTQFYISLPLAAKAIAGTADAVAWVYGVNAAATVLLGYPLPQLAQRRLRPPAMLVLGVALTAVGLAGVGMASGTAGLLAAVLLFSTGMVLVRPSEQTVAANLANPTALGSYFGVASLSVAIGGGLGNYAGGALYDLGLRLNRPALPWFFFCVIGLAAAVGLWRTMLPVKGRAKRPLVAEA